MKGKAKEAEKLAKHYKDLIPKTAKLIEQTGKLGLELGVKLNTYAKNEELRKKNAWGDPLSGTLENQKALNKIQSLGWKDLNEKSDDFSHDTLKEFAGRLSLNWMDTNSNVYSTWTDNEKIEKAAVFAAAKQAGVDLNQYTSDDFFIIAGYLRLDELGINPNSKHGAKILARFERWGTEHGQGIQDAEDERATTDNILSSFSSMDGTSKLGIDGDDEDSLANVDSLTNTVHGGINTLRTTGVIKDPQSGTYIRLSKQPRMDSIVHYIATHAKYEGYKYDVDTYLDQVWGKVRAFPNKGETVSKEFLINKLSPENREYIEQELQKSHTTKTTKANNHKKNTGNTLRVDYTSALTQWTTLREKKASAKDFQAAGLADTWPEFQHSWVQKIMESEADGPTKLNLLTELSLMGPNVTKDDVLTYLDVWSPLTDYSLEGEDYDRQYRVAVNKYQRLPEGTRKRLRPEFERFNNVHEAGYIYDGKSGISAWFGYFENHAGEAEGAIGSGAFITGRKTKHLTDTGKEAAKDMAIRAESIYHRILPDYLIKHGETDGYHLARVEAFKIVEAEFALGAPKGKETIGEGRYRRTKAGGFGGGWVYANPLFDSTGGQNYVISEIDASLIGADGSSPITRWMNESIETIPSNDIKYLYATGEITAEDIFNKGNIISPDVLTKLDELALNLSEPYKRGEEWRGDVSYELPKEARDNAQAIAETLTKGTGKKWDTVDVLNRFGEKYGKKYRFAPNGESAYYLQSNGEYTRDDDRYGIAAFGSIVWGQGLESPKKEHIRLNFKEGFDIKTSFLQAHEIKLDESTGNLFDPEDAINKTVLNQPFADEAFINQIFPYGIQGLPPEVITQAAPKKKYISPRERKFGRKK